MPDRPYSLPKRDWNEFNKIPFFITAKMSEIQVDGSLISFKFQNGPINEVGVNGCQIEELLKAYIAILDRFNKMFPCRENAITLTHCETALLWQQKRREDREKRGVEGKYEL